MSETEPSTRKNHLVFTNITSTFTGIGYVVVDVNGLVLSTEQLYNLSLRQLPMQTIREHFFYVVQNLAASALQDLRFYYELTGDPWLDLALTTLNDGSFIDYSGFSEAAEQDRIALVLSVGARVPLVEYCHSVGLYVGTLDSLIFVYPYSNCNILRPSETLVKGISYKTEAQHGGAEACLRSLCDFLEKRAFSIDSMNAEFMKNDQVYVFDPLTEEIGEETARNMLQYNRKSLGTGGQRLYFDGRIYFGKRRVCTAAGKKADRGIFRQTPETPWGGKDLDLIMPPIPDRPNLKHLANIRKSALSMYDRTFQYSTIPDSKKASEAPKKISAKMQKIMDENAVRIRTEKEKAANAWLRGFYTNYSKMASLSAKKTYIENIKMDNEYINNKLSLLKIELYMDIWRLEQRGTAVDEKVLVPLYLSCLSFIEKNCVLRGGAERDAGADPVELEFVLNKLIEAHFEATVHEIMEKYIMPPLALSFKTKATSSPNDIDLYFQLKCAGDHLKRTLGTRKDKRVPFDPDKWQVDLLDAVDSSKSAIVAAPTSSGKTFICFYAIEKILKSSDTDVVVFCLPTKALANQVSADIYARFNPKSCRMALQGTLMADRCTDPFNCQILITIPAMLESLMASRGCDSIKYIIIDEVHKINDELIGLSIERIIHLSKCPLLLLSATIGNLDRFYGWFRAIEEGKGIESVLITHTERFCELKPYIYCNQTHPDLSSLTVSGAGAAAGSLMPLNCMFAYSFSHLKEFGFSDDISFLPEELLNLYYYIYLVLAADQKRLIKKLAPKKFFKSNIICKADTKEYQRHLLTTFQNWVQEGILTEQQVKEVYNLLVGKTLDIFPLVSTEEYLVSNILDLLNSLKEKDMLPVIIFNMDREFVTRLAKAVYQELESQDLRKRKDKMAEKLKKENKRNRDNEKTRDSWIDDSIMSEQAVEPESRDIRYTFLDQVTKLTDAEIREELSDVRGTPRFATDMVYRGIGIHHAAMERKYRSAVEILFRKKHVRVLFATETLALGINMPCRTVVFAGDSLALDPMNYKQMAGRAGRRGYDTLGNVVFMGIPRGRVQNLMVSLLPQIQGPYTFSNTSLVSFNIEPSIVRNPLLGSTFLEGRREAGSYTFNHFSSEEKRRELVSYQKSAYPFIYPSCYLWDLYVSNRCEDPAIFIFGLMFHLDKIVWDQESFIRTVAHLFEVRPCSADTVLEPMPAVSAEFVAQVNSIYAEDVRHFYSPQLRTLSNMRGEPLHYIKSFLFHPTYPKNSYILDFFRHGSAGRISVRNRVSEGELWQSLYNIDYMLSSFIKMIETHCGASDARLRKLKVVYATLHGKFREIFA